MRWHLSFKADPRGRPLADRHYNRQKVGAPQFAPPGRALVLLTADATALWITSWPLAEFVKHAWPGAWVNSLFRNERRDLHLSSDLIIEAIAATRAVFGAPPALGLVTFIDSGKVRRKRDPGRCYRRAGFVAATPATTEGGLIALQLLPESMPAADPPIGFQTEAA
jgi:hypothetical protein